MGLTSTSFLVLLVALTFAAMAMTLLLWGRVPGPGWLRWPLRTLMIVLCQVTAIATVATDINNSYGLYASWGDLLGTVDANATAMTGPPPKRAKFTEAANGVRTTYFRGPHSHLAGRVLVWTPPEYADRAHRGTHFPVIMLLHGVPGAPESWIEQGGMPGTFAQLVRQGAARPAILVMPVIDPGGEDTDCTDTPHRKVARWLADDVPTLIAQHFRALPGPRGTGVMGISTGGFCAAKLPLQYPKVFGAGVALDPDPLSGDAGVLSDAGLRERTSPMWLVAHHPPPTSLFLGTSAQDPDSPPSYIEEFVKAAAGTDVKVTTRITSGGGHNWGTWTAFFPQALPWLSDRLDAPR
ncbi:alpha/beta hydrolase [Streptomyces xanthochromogenes]|uniref:alpha/beta hydrolase n=1 Tax=Streptomyces xanthochromogenes TaxID=67384 RepID=UPI003419D5CC